MTTTASHDTARRPDPDRTYQAGPLVWTQAAVHGLGLTTTVERAAQILGISRTKAYALAKDGQFPVRLIRIGRRYLVPTTALLDLLGAQDPPPGW